MANAAGHSGATLKWAPDRELADADFFWALRLLQAVQKHACRIGESRQLAEDWIRLRQAPHFSHPGGSIERFTPGADGGPAELRVQFTGLFGPQGALPMHVTDAAAERQRQHRDESLWRFIDLFHHRALSLLFKAWAKHQPTADLDRPETAVLPRRIGALLGVGQEALWNRGKWSDHARLFYAGRLVSPVRNAEGLERIVTDFFRVPVEVIPFCGHWIDLPESSRCALGQSEATGTLGKNVFAGEHIWDCQTKFRIRVGPVGRRDFERFLPHTASCQRLAEIVRFYVGFELAWDVQCVLRADDVPETVLGGGARLGWTSWLKTQPFTRDADELILNLEERIAA